MLVYKIDVLKTLKEAGYSTTILQKQKLIAGVNITRLRQGIMVGNIALNQICELLNMQPGDIIGYIPDGLYVSTDHPQLDNDNDKPSLSRKQKQLIDLVKKASPDTVDLMFTLLKKLEMG